MIQDDRIQSMERQLTRIAKDPEGQELLARKFGLQITRADDPSIPKVAVLVPCNDALRPKTHAALEQMVAWTRQQGGVVVYQPRVTGHSLLPKVRNDMVEEVYRDPRPFTHILFVDSDIVPDADYLVRLLAHKQDVVGTLCTRRSDPPIPNMFDFDAEAGQFSMVRSWGPGLRQAASAGTGMILISKNALDKAAEAYIQCLHEQFVGFGVPEKIVAARRKVWEASREGEWFEMLSRANGAQKWGEDVSFCWKCRLAGVPVYVDTDLLPLHLGEYGYSIPDYLSQMRILWPEQLCLLRARNTPEAEKMCAEIEKDMARVEQTIARLNAKDRDD